ncbi:GNAT family N-acetyltransferase [Streptomyces sp. NPDC059696]|uniref:GNAT family N-acetyltransferase n=1 Tax=Streptomyces sp. NPDC059696 TaxID=3346911 RepID=UPI0036CE6C87
MTGLRTAPLDASTWPDFAGLVERHNGVWGGCWCMAFHPEGLSRGRSPEQNRSAKETRVREGGAHAALVYDGRDCAGWCQFGPPSELPRIKHRRAYEKDLGTPPDWRITCFFVGRDHRRTGVAAAALEGALHEIARLGGGTVEGYPEDTEGRPVSPSFLYGGTVRLFEDRGFERIRRLGKHHWVVSRDVRAEPVRAGRTGGS